MLYPNFDRTPLPPINYGPGHSDSGSLIAATPSAPPLPQGQQVIYVSMFRGKPSFPRLIELCQSSACEMLT